MRSADRIAGAALLALAVAFGAGALRSFPYWGENGPGPAFLPFWLGLVMALLALTMLLRSLRDKNAGEAWFPRGEGLRDMLVVLAVTVAYVALLDVTGMVVGTALYLAVLVRYLGKHRWWVTLSVALGAGVFNWLVFVHWLRVPMPEGMFWTF